MKKYRKVYEVEHKEICQKGWGLTESDCFENIDEAYAKANEYRNNGFSARVVQSKIKVSNKEDK